MITRESISKHVPVIGKIINDTPFAFNGDIIKTFYKDIPYAVSQTKDIAKTFRGATIEQTCKNIWNFLKYQIRYKADKDDLQPIKLPSQFLASGVGDCKSFALFTAAILDNLKIPYQINWTNYRDKFGKAPDYPATPSHVYVTAYDNLRPVIIDGVYNLFNVEKPFYYKTSKPMRVVTIAGLDKQGCGCPGKKINQPSVNQMLNGIYGFSDIAQQELTDLTNAGANLATGNVIGAGSSVFSSIKHLFGGGDTCSNTKTIMVYDFMRDGGRSKYSYTECYIRDHTAKDHDQFVKGWPLWGYSSYQDLVNAADEIANTYGSLPRVLDAASTIHGAGKDWFMNFVFGPWRNNRAQFNADMASQGVYPVPSQSGSGFNPNAGQTNYLPWVIGGIAAVTIISGIAYYSLKK